MRCSIVLKWKETKDLSFSSCHCCCSSFNLICIVLNFRKIKNSCVHSCCRSRVSSARFQRPLLVLEASHGVSWVELIRNIRWVNPRKRETRARNPRPTIGRTTKTVSARTNVATKWRTWVRSWNVIEEGRA